MRVFINPDTSDTNNPRRDNVHMVEDKSVGDDPMFFKLICESSYISQ